MLLIQDVNLYQNHFRKILQKSIKSYIPKQFLQENTILSIKISKTQSSMLRKYYAQQALIEHLGVPQKEERKKVIIKVQNASQVII